MNKQELKCIKCGYTKNLYKYIYSVESQFPLILCKKCKDISLKHMLRSCIKCGKSGVKLYTYWKQLNDIYLCYDCINKKLFKEIKQEGDK